jgi:DNA primase
VDAVSSDLPPGVDVKLFLKHGFYQHKNKLYFKTAKGIRQGANFTLQPLFHVKSLTEAKRLFRIKNEYGATEIIELMQKDLTSLQAFKLRVESLGNFLWVLGEAELARLKGWL